MKNFNDLKSWPFKEAQQILKRNGGLVNFNFSICSYEKNMEGSITIFGTKGTVKIGGAYLNELTYQAIEDYKITIEQSTQQENDYGSYKGSMSNHDQVYANMMQVLNDQASPITSLEEARNTVYWIEQMYGRK